MEKKYFEIKKSEAAGRFSRGISRIFRCVIFPAYVILFLSGCFPGERFSGRISSDTIWQGRILLEGDVYVEPGVKLTVLPGTQIRFSGAGIKSDIQLLRSSDGGTYDLFSPSRIEIIVGGDIDISGTEENPVLLSPPRNDPDISGGINFIGSECRSSISHLIINGGFSGIRIYDMRSPVIDNLTVRGTSVNAIGCWGRASPVITGALVENSKYGIGASDSASPVISGSVVRNNSAAGIFFEGQSRGEVLESEISGNNVGVAAGDESAPFIYKSTVSGNGSGIGCWKSSAPRIENNVFISNIVGVLAVDESEPEITGNLFRGNGAGGSFGDRASGTMKANRVSGSGPGLVIIGSASPAISENLFYGNEYGVRAEGRSSPLLTDNVFRENRFGFLKSEYSAPVYRGNIYEENQADTVDSRFR